MTRLKNVCAGLLPLVLVALAGCTTAEPPPTLSLDGPTKIAFAKTCFVGEEVPRQRLAPAACDAEGAGVLVERGYLSNQLGNTVAVVNFNFEIPELIDTRPDVPGVTHIPVGQRPTEIVASADGNFVFVFNQVDKDISVIAADLQREITRIPVGASISNLFAARASADEASEALWLVLPEQAQIVEVVWSFKCNGGATYVEQCEPDFTFDSKPLHQLPPGSLPRHATLSATGDSLLMTFGDRAHLTEVLLAAGRGGDGDTRACLDGGDVPCAVKHVGLTFGCSDGLDNDGDGKIDAADPQCLDPEAPESPGGIGRARATACNDGLDNDGDGKIDAADTGCAFSGDGSELGAVIAVACSDGLDNDGDGNIDADDADCALGPWHRSEARPPACSDGEDNDGDGQSDDDDPQCTSSLQDDESRRPACSDANDNDNDGLIDDDDPDCVSPLSDNEGPSSTACNDGIDNDLDGAVDLLDPGCNGPEGETEQDAARPCSDGVDNDGDGLVDYPADPDCYGANGSGESQFPVYEFGPLAADPSGRFVYVVDRRETQVIVLDMEAGTLLDPNACAEGDTGCTPRPFADRVGVGVSRLPQSIVARRLQVADNDSPSAEGSDLPGRFRIVREQSFAVVASSRGSAFFINGAQIVRTFDNAVLTEELVDPIVRLGDSQNNDASASTVLCELDRVRDVAPFNAGTSCDDPRLPAIRPIGDGCDPDVDEGCECEDDGAGNEVCFSDPAAVKVRTRDQLVVDFFDEGDNQGEINKRRESFTDDPFVPDDAWTVVYEGPLNSRADIIVDDVFEGMVRSTGGNFCGDDLRPGDILTITSSVTPLAIDGEAPECEVYQERDLSYRVARVSANHLTLEVIDAELAALLNRPEEANPLVEQLPVRACFGAGLGIEVRPLKQWVVTGNRTGRLSNQTSFGGVCVQRFDNIPYTSRLNTGEVFSNPFFTFRLRPGTEAIPPGHTFTFSTAGRFSASQLVIGATPTDLGIFDTQKRIALPIIDAGNNLVRVFDANSNRLVTVLF